MLPFDIHCKVMSIVNFHTLKVCSLLSRAHHEAVAHHLWKTFTIATTHQGFPHHACSHIKTCANFISHGFGVTHVCRLCIFINAVLGSSDQAPLICTSIVCRWDNNILWELPTECSFDGQNMLSLLSWLLPLIWCIKSGKSYYESRRG